MERIVRLWRRLKMLAARGQFERDLDEEMRFHRDMLGADAPRFGNASLLKEMSRDAWGFNALETAFQDLRYALRGMRKSPVFSAVAILSLALGIGANTAIFGIVHAVLLRPLPYPDPGRLVELKRQVGSIAFPDMTVAEMDFCKTGSAAFSSVAGFRGGGEQSLTLGSQRLWVRTLAVTTDFFRTLRVQPAIGREFQADETRPAGPRAVVITNALWRRTFASDPNLLGRTIVLDDAGYTVIGILPESFWFPEPAAAFVPLRPTGGVADTGYNTEVLARVRSDLNIAQAHAETAPVFERYRRAYPNFLVREENGIALQPWRDALVGDVRLNIWLLFAATALLLAIACSNLASLVLARFAARRKEIAIRTALGGGRIRLLRQFLVENFVLTVCGGAAGVACAYVVLKSLISIVPFSLPSAAPITLDSAALVFALAIAIATGILFSFAPLVTAGGIDLNAGLNVGGRSDAAGSARQRVRSVLVISQVALSVGLLVSSGLLIQTLYRLSKERLGFDPEGLITFSTPFSAERRHSGANLWTYERTLLERLQAIPGVRSAAAINVFPLAGRNNIPGQREAHPEQSIGALEYRIVTPAWFEAMRIPILQGRGFVSDDKQGGPPVALINETLAQMWWPRGGALGGRIVVGRYEYRDFPDALEPARTVIGVVGDTKTEIARKARPTIYIPAAQAFGKGTAGMWWVVRAGALAGLSESIRSAIAGVDPTQRILRLQTVTRLVSSSTSDTRFEAWLLGAFASLALALTSIGIYGLLSFSVATRRHEIGTRIALGARRVDIFKMVLSHGFVLTAAGLLAGLAGALAFTRVMKRLLFGVTPTDPLSFAAVAIVLLAVGLLASYAPARRATKVDPLTALRHE